MRVEVFVWAVAIAVGLAAGTWSALTSAPENPLSRAALALTLSSAQSAELPAETVRADTQGSPSLGVQVATWVSHAVLDFLKTAWWVLPLPILFSLWRQFRAYEVCRACGSRELVPVVTPHGLEPPVF